MDAHEPPTPCSAQAALGCLAAGQRGKAPPQHRHDGPGRGHDAVLHPGGASAGRRRQWHGHAAGALVGHTGAPGAAGHAGAGAQRLERAVFRPLAGAVSAVLGVGLQCHGLRHHRPGAGLGVAAAGDHDDVRHFQPHPARSAGPDGLCHCGLRAGHGVCRLPQPLAHVARHADRPAGHCAGLHRDLHLDVPAGTKHPPPPAAPERRPARCAAADPADGHARPPDRPGQPPPDERADGAGAAPLPAQQPPAPAGAAGH